MEITELNILNDFQSSIKCLQNPPLISRFQLSSLCKWGALIVALLATFTSLITRIKLIIFRLPKVKSLTSSSSFKHLQTFNEDFDFSDDDNDNDDDDNHEWSETETDDQELNYSSYVEEDFRVAGSYSKLRRRIGGHRFSWSDFAAGKSVVQLWDGFELGLGLGLDFDDDFFGSEIKILSESGSSDIVRCQNPAVAISSDVVLLAESSKNDTVFLSGYDTRVGGKIPAIYADWKGENCRVVDVKHGGDKVYVKNGITGGVTVGDVRNVKTPLEKLTELDEDDDDDSWWDADGVTY